MPEDRTIAEQFEDPEQQLESSTLGMWAFLATEVLFFGVLFAAYMVLRTRWPEAFRRGSEELHLWIGGINTAVLLTSSLFVALAVRAAALGHRRALVWHLVITIALGLTFLGLKAVEWTMEYHERLIPGIAYSDISPHGAVRPPQQQLFMVLYFIMTGFHALHMVIGVGVLGTLAVLAWRGYFSPEYHNPVEIAGLYWHFVDIVWVFLYPALYLLHMA